MATTTADDDAHVVHRAPIDVALAHPLDVARGIVQNMQCFDSWASTIFIVLKKRRTTIVSDDDDLAAPPRLRRRAAVAVSAHSSEYLLLLTLEFYRLNKEFTSWLPTCIRQRRRQSRAHRRAAVFARRLVS
jgi:hypothetical protein